jgi:hypothetical protein
MKLKFERLKNYLNPKNNEGPIPSKNEPFIKWKMSVEKKSIFVSYLKSLKFKILPYQLNFEGALLQSLVDLYGNFSDLVMVGP